MQASIEAMECSWPKGMKRTRVREKNGEIVDFFLDYFDL
jgi:hypothetical protein